MNVALIVAEDDVGIVELLRFFLGPSGGFYFVFAKII